MLFNINLVEDLHDRAVLIDQESLPVNARVLLAVHRFFDPDTVFLHDFLVGVGDQVELKSIFRSKLLMGLLAVGRNSQKLYILFFKCVVRITERACFLGSARGVVFGVEKQHGALSSEI